MGVGQVLFLTSDDLGIVANVVEVIAGLDKAVVRTDAIAVFAVIIVAEETVEDFTVPNAVLIKDISNGSGPLRQSDGADTGIFVALVVKCISAAVDLYELRNAGTAVIESGTVVVLGADLVSLPNTLNNTTVVEGEAAGNTVDAYSACSNNAVNALVFDGIEVIPVVAFHLPAGCQLAEDEVVVDAADIDKAGSGRVDLENVAAFGADELAVDQLIFVAGSGDNGTPVDDGVTVGIRALGAAGVAFFGAGSGLILDRNLVVIMPLADGVLQVRDTGVELGHDVLTDVREAGDVVSGCVNGIHDILNLAEERLVADGDSRAGSAVAVGSAGGPLGVGVDAGGAVPSPSVDRDREQGLLTGEGGTIVGDGDGRLAGDIIDVKVIAEALSGSRILERPLGCGVQPDGGGDLVDLLSLIGVDQQVVLAAHLDLAVTDSLSYKGDNRIVVVSSVYGDLLGHLGDVALLVRDLEGDIVDAVGQSEVTGCDLAGGELAGNFIAVDVDLSGRTVDTGRVAGVVDGILNSVSGEAEDVGVDSGAVQSIGTEVVQRQRVADDGSVAVVNNVGVVEGDVVDVEGNVLSALRGGRNDPLDERGSVVAGLCTGQRTVSILIVRSGDIGVGNIIEVAVDICPAGLGNLVGGELGEALLHILIGEVQISGADGAVRRLIGVGQTRAGTDSLFGDVHPHTKTGACDAVRGVAEDLGVAGVVQITVHPVLEGSALGIVEGVAESVVTGVNLTAVIAGCEEGAFLDAGRNVVGSSGRPVGLYALVRHGVAAGVFAVGNSLFHAAPVEPVGNVAVFKVEEDFGSLTVGNGNGDGSDILVILIGRGDGTGSDGLILGRIVHEVLHITGSHIEIVCVSSSIHLGAVVHRGDGEVSGLAVRNGLLACGESDRSRVDNGDVDGTDNLAVIQHVRGYSTESTVGIEHAVFDGAERSNRSADADIIAGSEVNSLVADIVFGNLPVIAAGIPVVVAILKDLELIIEGKGMIDVILAGIAGILNQHICRIGSPVIESSNEVIVSTHELSGGRNLTVGQRPCNALSGEIGSAAGSVSAGCVDNNLGVGCIVSIVGGEVRMVKGTVGNGGGDDHQGVGDGTDSTVAAYVADFDLVGTLGLRGIGSGTAAVQLDRVNASELEHQLSLLCIC